MSQVSEVPVTINSRNAEHGIVAVPEECYQLCGKLPALIGEAAINQLNGGYDAIVCDKESRMASALRRCDAMRFHFKSEGSRVSPMSIGESNPRPISELVDEAISEHGARDLVSARKHARK